MPPKSAVGIAMLAWKAWRRLPPAQRALILSQVRKKGPRAAAAAAAVVRSRRAR